MERKTQGDRAIHLPSSTITDRDRRRSREVSSSSSSPPRVLLLTPNTQTSFSPSSSLSSSSVYGNPGARKGLSSPQESSNREGELKDSLLLSSSFREKEKKDKSRLKKRSEEEGEEDGDRRTREEGDKENSYVNKMNFPASPHAVSHEQRLVFPSPSYPERRQSTVEGDNRCSSPSSSSPPPPLLPLDVRLAPYKKGAEERCEDAMKNMNEKRKRFAQQEESLDSGSFRERRNPHDQEKKDDEGSTSPSPSSASPSPRLSIHGDSTHKLSKGEENCRRLRTKDPEEEEEKKEEKKKERKNRERRTDPNLNKTGNTLKYNPTSFYSVSPSSSSSLSSSSSSSSLSSSSSSSSSLSSLGSGEGEGCFVCFSSPRPVWHVDAGKVGILSHGGRRFLKQRKGGMISLVYEHALRGGGPKRYLSNEDKQQEEEGQGGGQGGGGDASTTTLTPPPPHRRHSHSRSILSSSSTRREGDETRRAERIYAYSYDIL
ncbi:hypothetical protein CSUI_004641, partial [Cystoisospora suis]